MIFWKSIVMCTRHTGTYSTRNYCTRSFHFSPECTKIVSGWGSAPDPAGGAYSAPPNPLAVMGWDGDLVTNFWGVNYVPLARGRCPLAVLRLATGLLMQQIPLFLSNSTAPSLALCRRRHAAGKQNILSDLRFADGSAWRSEEIWR